MRTARSLPYRMVSVWGALSPGGSLSRGDITLDGDPLEGTWARNRDAPSEGTWASQEVTSYTDLLLSTE